MSLEEIVAVLRGRWVSILLLAVLGVVAAAATAFTTPKAYVATAESFISFSGERGGSNLSGNSQIVQRMASYVAIAQTPIVLEPVIEQLGLNTSVSALASQVTASSPVATVLIDVAVTDGDAAQAAKIANAVAAQLGTVIQDLEKEPGATASPLKVSLVDPAETPAAPISPQPAKSAVVGGLAGLVIGIALAFVRSALGNTIKTSTQIERIAGSAPVGVVFFDPDAKTNPVAISKPGSPRAEAFRTLRTNLQYVDIDNPPQVMALTSSIPGEGKTTTACNLAVVLAQAGSKVVLVEADLRRPRVAEYLGLDNSRGLTDVLASRASWQTTLIPWNRGLLAVLPSGPVPPNPSELLGTGQMESLLAALRQHFDYVILDSPPLLPVTDATVLARICDGAVVIVRHGRTTPDMLERAVASIHRVDARLLGTVINFVPIQKRGYGHGYGYGYGYGYGPGYESNAGTTTAEPVAQPGPQPDPAVRA